LRPQSFAQLNIPCLDFNYHFAYSLVSGTLTIPGLAAGSQQNRVRLRKQMQSGIDTKGGHITSAHIRAQKKRQTALQTADKVRQPLSLQKNPH
jgi:riboflavin synthase alpha subunit